MRQRSKHDSRSHWLLEQVRWEVEHNAPKPTWWRRVASVLMRKLDSHPFTFCGVLQVLVFAAAWGSGYITVSSLNRFEVEAAASVIGISWQIVATFASIAFAGLTVLMQVASEPVVTSRSAREVLFEETHFRPVLAFSITASIQVGVAALFLDRTESAIVEVSVVGVTILWMGLSYARVGLVFAKPGEALRLGQAALERDLMSSLRHAHSRSVAEERLHALVPQDWSFLQHDSTEVVPVLVAPRADVLDDVDFDLLRDIVKEIADDDSTAPVASDAPPKPQEGTAANAPELRISTSLGSSVDTGRPVFVLTNAGSFSGDLGRLGDRLAKAVRWGKAE